MSFHLLEPELANVEQGLCLYNIILLRIVFFSAQYLYTLKPNTAVLQCFYLDFTHETMKSLALKNSLPRKLLKFLSAILVLKKQKEILIW